MFVRLWLYLGSSVVQLCPLQSLKVTFPHVFMRLRTVCQLLYLRLATVEGMENVVRM